MKELSSEKRQEVVHYYILGYSYEEIVGKTGVSHGTVSNIIREVDNGQLAIPGSTFDQVNDLRQLSLDLKKKNLEPSQAQLGLLLFEKFRALGITPEMIDKWAELTKRFTPVDFPAEEFFGIALRLHELEKTEGKPFEVLTEEYKRLQEVIHKLGKEVDALRESKSQLSKQIGPLGTQLEETKGVKKKLDNEVEIQTTKIKDLKLRTKEVEEERVRLRKEVKDLQRKKVRLSSEVDGKEESLRRLNDIGLQDEELLRLIAFTERMSRREGLDPKQIREEFFNTLSLFEEISEIKKVRKTQAERVEDLAGQKSILDGEIAELKKTKGILESQINEVVSSTIETITNIGQEAASQIGQQVTQIKKQFDDLLEGTLKAGEAIGGMQQIMIKGEESQKVLKGFLLESQSRLEGK